MKTVQKKSKAMKCKILIIVLLLFILSDTISGQSFSEKRTFRKSVKVNKEMSVDINNKYGNIHISSWNKDSVSIRAEVEAFATSQQRLGKMLEEVSVNITETDYSVRAVTDFTQSISMFFESFKGMTKKLIPYDSRVQINYFVSMPENLDLKIENRYGDVYMEDNTATISVIISNGAFKANSLNKASDLKLTFCDATINRINEGNVDGSFSEIVIGESKILNINSISSRYDLRSTGKLDTDSRRDKFFIGSLEEISGDAYFTDYKIESLSKEMYLLSKYGSITVDNVEKNVGLVTINSGYSDLNLRFDPSASYSLDIRHTNAFLRTPESNSSLETKSVSSENKEFMTFGTVGKKGGSMKVKIDANRGNIYIK
jgi:hypothetical protein